LQRERRVDEAVRKRQGDGSPPLLSVYTAHYESVSLRHVKGERLINEKG
jgi:hypothetical protein